MNRNHLQEWLQDEKNREDEDELHDLLLQVSTFKNSIETSVSLQENSIDLNTSSCTSNERGKFEHPTVQKGFRKLIPKQFKNPVHKDLSKNAIISPCNGDDRASPASEEKIFFENRQKIPYPSFPTSLSVKTHLTYTRPSSSLGKEYQPSNWNVICGRGKHIYNHVGNRRFRIIIATRLQEYVRAKSICERSEIVNSVLDQIHEAGPHAGFVKQDSKGSWSKIGKGMAREKVAHMFRDCMTGPLRRHGYPSPFEKWFPR